MVIHLQKRKLIFGAAALLFAALCLFAAYTYVCAENTQKEKSYIKWFELGASQKALEDAMELDVESRNSLYHIKMVESLAYLATKNGNDFSSYKSSQLEKLKKETENGFTADDLLEGNKYYDFYKKAYGAALGGLLGTWEKQQPDGKGGVKIKNGYGLIAYSPIAEGFSFSHYDDFGASRTFGYRRTHLGNDLLGNVGTPIVAVEGGTVESCGWNRFGGWRLGIRSFDKKRSYYYAHLRRGRPYAQGIKEGSVVKAGQVIGYLGMTGYSDKEDTNGMSVPHLHFGLQLIFDESQKEGENQIWLDVYSLVNLLNRNRATVVRDEKTGEYTRKYDLIKSEQSFEP